MQICYLWVERFRNLRDFSFNFDSNHRFSYDKDDHKISRKKIESLPKNFFPLPIKEVTALVGKNGAGKSNALELICKILKSGKSSFKFDFVLIYSDAKELHCSYKFGEKGLPRSNIRLNYHEHADLNGLKVIFYSNVFSDRQRDFGSGVIDLSPDRVDRPQFHNKNNRTSQLQKQIWFINSDSSFDNLGIKTPTHISITIARGPLDPGSARMYSPTHVLGKVAGRLRDRARSLGMVNRFLFLFSFAYLSKIVSSVKPSLSSSIDENKDFLDEIESLSNSLLNMPTRNLVYSILDFLDGFAIRLPNQHDLSNSESGRSVVLNKQSVEKQVRFIRESEIKLSNFEISEPETEFRNSRYFGFDLAYNLNSSSWFVDLLAAFEEMQFFSVDWIGISSGQRAYLNLFSLIAYEMRTASDIPVFICIDEGDLYLHPEWQLEFFYRLLNVLKRTNVKNIQLLLTSHSPFLLADLPKQNIVVLSNDPIESIPGTLLENETFAGNLYDLYAGPLFIDTLRTSLFAQEKISQLAIDVRSRPLSDAKRKNIQKRLSLIGDEIIKNIIKAELND